MNDLELIDRFGPAASEASDAALAAARARLDAASARSGAGVGRPRRRALLVAAAIAAVGIAVTPALLRSGDSIALAAVDPLTFPVSATWLPDGLGRPVFSRDSSHLQFARYGAPGADNINVTTTDSWDQWEDVDNLGSVDVNGHEARVLRQAPGDVTVAWQEGPDEIVGVTGRGEYADPSLVERIADSVIDKPQPVDLFLTIAPRGWPIMGYQSDHHISYGVRGELMVVLTSTQAGNPDGWGQDWRDVVVDGRPAQIGRQDDEDDTKGWALIATAPDGREFFLRAPSSLTEEQVIEIAGGVRHR